MGIGDEMSAEHAAHSARRHHFAQLRQPHARNRTGSCRQSRWSVRVEAFEQLATLPQGTMALVKEGLLNALSSFETDLAKEGQDQVLLCDHDFKGNSAVFSEKREVN